MITVNATESVKVVPDMARVIYGITTQEKAQALADASGSTLGHAVRITEFGDNQAARYQNAMRTSAKQEMAVEDAMVMMPGEISVEANISVEFAIQ